MSGHHSIAALRQGSVHSSYYMVQYIVHSTMQTVQNSKHTTHYTSKQDNKQYKVKDIQCMGNIQYKTVQTEQ